MTSPPVLEMLGIHKEYDGTPVLKGIDLALRAGELHALLGENGAGKSTLMNILFGMPVIHSTGGFEGSIRIHGKDVDVQSPAHAMRLGIGMVHQEFMLIPGFEIHENVKLNREPLRGRAYRRVLGESLDLIDTDTMRSDSRSALARIHLDVSETTLVSSLPVGHMQFVEIAREVDKKNLEVLVFDEPTAVLTESEATILLGVMRELADEGVAILFITHRLEEVMSVADSVTILRDGSHVVTTAREKITIEEIAEKMIGRNIESGLSSVAKAAPSAESDDSADVILEIRDLEVDMPGEMVRGVDLSVSHGEILGIAGLAGQGKVGIANGLMGLYPARGKVTFAGNPLSLNAPREALTAGLAFVSEDRRGVGLLLGESIEMNIAIPSMVICGSFLKGKALGPLAWVDRKAVRSNAESMIDKLDIRTTGPDQIVRRLSGGNQQKVCLARALCLEPKMLFVSEPTRGIDIGAKQIVLDWLTRLNREQGITIVITSSELAELRSICQRIAIICEGKLAGILASDANDVQFGLLMSGKASA